MIRFGEKIMKEKMLLCTVFRSEYKEGAYLYAPFKTDGSSLDKVPDELKRGLGQLTEVMKLKLTATRKLANADPVRVMSSLDEKGYYLQLPPLDLTRPASMDEAT